MTLLPCLAAHHHACAQYDEPDHSSQVIDLHNVLPDFANLNFHCVERHRDWAGNPLHHRIGVLCNARNGGSHAQREAGLRAFKPSQSGFSRRLRSFTSCVLLYLSTCRIIELFHIGSLREHSGIWLACQPWARLVAGVADVVRAEQPWALPQSIFRPRWDPLQRRDDVCVKTHRNSFPHDAFPVCSH